MDQIVVAAGTALVGAMATDAWQQARTAVLALWQRVHPERVPVVEAELEEARGNLLAARDTDDNAAEEALAVEWQGRLRALLRRNPSLGDELRRVLDEELAPLLPPAATPSGTGVRMEATASGQARIFQAGRDQTIHER
ncbi:hypothetical protein [Streptomyces sp. SP18CS02]|uniref:hypothetical protein n=1 Tax=Streptomyces sp. SP18CS02 TaxID=3002531 RepID=UPI002E786EA0|nr:hypothetical protein [Streptomyces sp. SP18CS02]MEE1753231.1 hypothetical protein [Streptomyces sp. SP18CS02]